MLQFVTCFLVLEIIANVECTKPRSVNIALETILKFDNKDNAADVRFIDDVQKFLAKVRDTVDKKKSGRRYNDENNSNNLNFIDFVRELIGVLKNYDNDDLEDIFSVIDDEIRKYHYKGCKFYELVEDHNIRRFVTDKLEQVKEKPAEEIRRKLDFTLQALNDAKYDTKQSELLDYINSLFTKDDGAEFRRILDNLEIYKSKTKRSNIELINIVRDSIRTVIFDHYSGLNVNTRRDFKLKLETIWNPLKRPDQIEHRVWTIEYNNTKVNIEKTHSTNSFPHYYTPVSIYKKEIKNVFYLNNAVSRKREKSKAKDNKRSPVDTRESSEVKVSVMDYKEETTHKNTKDADEELSSDVKDSGYGREGKSENESKIKSERKKKRKTEKPNNSDDRYGNIRDDDLILIEKPVIWNKDDSSDKDSDTSNSKDDVSTATEAVTTKGNYKKQHKSRHKKLKTTTPLFVKVESKEFERHILKANKHSKSKKKHKKQNHKMSSFVTLYPKAVTSAKQKRFKVESSESKEKMVTLWQEEIPKKKHHRHKEKKVKDSTSDDSKSEIIVEGVEIPVNDYRTGKQNKGGLDLKYLRSAKKQSKIKETTNTKDNNDSLLSDADKIKKDIFINSLKEGVSEYLKSRFDMPSGPDGLQFKLTAHKNKMSNLKRHETAEKSDTDEEDFEKIIDKMPIRRENVISQKHPREPTEDDLLDTSSKSKSVEEQDNNESYETVKTITEEDVSSTPKREITVETFPSRDRKTAKTESNLLVKPSESKENSVYSLYYTRPNSKTPQTRRKKHAKSFRRSNTLDNGGKQTKLATTVEAQKDVKSDTESSSPQNGSKVAKFDPLIDVPETNTESFVPTTENIFPQLDFWVGTTKNINEINTTDPTVSTTPKTSTTISTSTSTTTKTSTTRQTNNATNKKSAAIPRAVSTASTTSKPTNELGTTTETTNKDNLMELKETNKVKQNNKSENVNKESTTAAKHSDIDDVMDLAEFMEKDDNGSKNKRYADEKANTIEPAIEEQLDDLFDKYGLTTLPDLPRNYLNHKNYSFPSPYRPENEAPADSKTNVTEDDSHFLKTTQDSDHEKKQSLLKNIEHDMLEMLGSTPNVTPGTAPVARRRHWTFPSSADSTTEYLDPIQNIELAFQLSK